MKSLEVYLPQLAQGSISKTLITNYSLTTFINKNIQKTCMKAQTATEYIVLFLILLTIVTMLAANLTDIKYNQFEEAGKSQIVNQQLESFPIGITKIDVNSSCARMQLINNNDYTVNVTQILLDNNAYSSSDFPITLDAYTREFITICGGHNFASADTFSLPVKLTYQNILTNDTFNYENHRYILEGIVK